MVKDQAAVVGLMAGSFYSWMVEGGGQPLAKTLAGLLAGLVAGGLVWEGLALYGQDVGLSVLTASVVAVVGGLFKVSERWIVRTFSGRCPRTLSAPVVAGLIAAVVGAGVWILASALDAAANGAFGRVLQELPAGFLGGMLGGLVTGALLELLGVPLMDDEHLV